jgi:ATP-dependent Lon protease
VSENTLLDIIRYYTREAGVRNLEREISKICRKSVKQLLAKPETKAINVSPRNLSKYLGVRRFRYGRAEEQDHIGQVTGLAWTEVGGELLTIEAAVVAGKGKLTHTGQLGEVMQESIQAAMTVVRSRAVGARPRSRFLSEGRRAHSRAGRRNAEGRPERRHRHVHCAGLGA